VHSGIIQKEPHEFFLEEAKVALNDGKMFGEGYEHFVRLNFGTSRALIAEGLERIVRALK
jgi:cystathionine beta-lyase